MKHKFYLMTAVLFSTLASAQTIRVDRVKGTKAIVEIVSGSVKAGQSYTFSVADLEELTDENGHIASTPKGSRANIIGVSASFSSLSVSTGGASNSSSVLSISGRFGWNKVQTEYGPLISFSSTSSSGSSVTAFLVGGFYDFNLNPNRASSDMVIGFGGEAAIGSAPVSSTSTTAVSTWYIYPSGFVKWFVFKNSTALRGDLGLLYQSYQSSPASTISGVQGRLALAHYF